MDDFIPIAQAIAGAATIMIPMVWRLASRLAKMESLDESRAQDTREKLENIEQELNLIRESREKAADVERQGRKELWVEVSALRERLVKIETKMGDQS
tara:strand:+ start:341 stop:634 length:294 start_codon:yes stop_codon:yes gene_type:complete